MKKELSFNIDGVELGTRMFIDEFGGDGVWLSMHINGGHCNMAVSFDAAREMIAALQKVIEASE